MLNNKGIVITDIVRILHPIGHGNGYTSVFTQPGGLPTHEIILRLSGEADSVFDGVRFHTCTGDIKYLPQGQGSITHETHFDSGECINIFFYADEPLCDSATVFEAVDFDEFKRIFEKAEMLWLKKDTGYKYEVISALYKILALIEKEQGRRYGQNSGYMKIKPAVEYLNMSFRSDNIDFEQIASMCNISYSYFRRLFSECMGTSPAKYVVDKRIEYAKDMLAARQYSISEISDAAGFNDVYYFSHVFKKLVGVPPSQFVAD